MGVYAPDKLDLVAGAMAQLGIRHGRVVHARNGIDEIALSPTDSILVAPPAPLVRAVIHPEDAGLAPASLSQLQGADTAQANATLLEGILTGAEHGPRRDVVLLNAAAALEAAGLASSLQEGATRAAAAIDSGAARQTLQALRDFAATQSA
jgi:anthranilate phosphoribosyltransferase